MKGHYLVCGFNPEVATNLLPTLTRAEVLKPFCDIMVEIAKLNNIDKREELGHWRINEAWRIVYDQMVVLQDMYSIETKDTTITVFVVNNSLLKSVIFKVNEITAYEKA